MQCNFLEVRDLVIELQRVFNLKGDEDTTVLICRINEKVEYRPKNSEARQFCKDCFMTCPRFLAKLKLSEGSK